MKPGSDAEETISGEETEGDAPSEVDVASHT